MSKTNRQYRSVKETRWNSKHKMRPYLADKDMGGLKYAADGSRRTGTSKMAKLVRDNANRSLKKTAIKFNPYQDE